MRPQFAIWDAKHKVHYNLREDLNADNLDKFLISYGNGKLAPSYKSAEPPASQKANLHVSVSTTFSKIVTDETKVM